MFTSHDDELKLFSLSVRQAFVRRICGGYSPSMTVQPVPTGQVERRVFRVVNIDISPFQKNDVSAVDSMWLYIFIPLKIITMYY